jgi:hypothetical protein
MGCNYPPTAILYHIVHSNNLFNSCCGDGPRSQQPTQMTSTPSHAPDRAEFIKPKHLEYLDALRLSGVTNMFGAATYLICEFPELDKRQARAVLSYWMTNFKG